MISKKKDCLGDIDRILYRLGIVALFIAFAAVLLYFVTGVSVLHLPYLCVFNRVTGYPCPGCGGTRAARALLEGNILRSLWDYPPLLYAVVVYVVFMVRCFIIKHFVQNHKNVKKYKDGAVVVYIYIFVALMLLQWIVKFIAQLIFGYTWVY